MSRIVVVEKNKDGKIELTKDELQKLLDDSYNQGFSDSKAVNINIPYYPSYPYSGYPIWYDNSRPITTDKWIITCNTAE